jgi:bacterioferritin-associated ferredoxin
MNIDRCICTGITFAQALAKAEKEKWTFDDLKRELGVGANCGLCRPYLRRALATGEAVFHEIITDRP